MEGSRRFHIRGIYKGDTCDSNDRTWIDMATQKDEQIDISRRDVRAILLYEFRLGLKASEAANKICSTMGADVLSIARPNIGSLVSVKETTDSTTNPSPKDRWRSIWIF